MAFRFKFSLLTLVIAITLFSMLAALIVYLQPRDLSRHHAPDYVLDMMDAAEVKWSFDKEPEFVGGLAEVDFPRHPKHEYILITSIKTKDGKHLSAAGKPPRWPRLINGEVAQQKEIGVMHCFISKDRIPQPQLPTARMWLEIRIEDEFGNVLFHDVKQSDTYAQARARQRP